MKTLIRLLVIFLTIFYGCSLFKKTSKTINKNIRSSATQMESTRLLWKHADKETQVFTYWNDSGFYQFQQIREKLSQAKSGRIKTEKRQQSKQEMTIKKKEPLRTWMYIAMVTLVLGCLIVYKRFNLNI